MTDENENIGGRPTDYQILFDKQAFFACSRNGATEMDLSYLFNVSIETLRTWKKRYNKFLAAIERGKRVYDKKVEKALRERALGYKHKAVKILVCDKDVVREEYIEHYPPDTAAASLWLRNRDPEHWRDKQDVQHSGNISTEDMSIYTDEELQAMRDIANTAKARQCQPQTK
jgi:hypothetical protein